MAEPVEAPRSSGIESSRREPSRRSVLKLLTGVGAAAGSGGVGWLARGAATPHQESASVNGTMPTVSPDAAPVNLETPKEFKVLSREAVEGEVLKEYRGYTSRDVLADYSEWSSAMGNAMYVVKREIVPQQEDRSKAEIIKTDKGMAIAIRIDARHLTDHPFTHLALEYYNGEGGRFGTQYKAKLPIETIKEIIDAQNPGKPREEQMLMLFLTNEALDPTFANVVKMESVKIPPRRPGIGSGRISAQAVTETKYLSYWSDNRVNFGDNSTYEVGFYDVAGKGTTGTASSNP